MVNTIASMTGTIDSYPQAIEETSVAENFRALLTAPTYVEDRCKLKTLRPWLDNVAILPDGMFMWLVGDYSAHIFADTLEGVYVAAYAIPPANGAWVRVYDGHINAKWFGAKGDGYTDSTVAIQACVDLVGFLGGGGVFIPTGKYKTTAQITVLSNYVRIIGEGIDATQIKPSNEGQNCFVFGNGDLILQYTGLFHLSIRPVAQIKAAVRVRNHYWFMADSVRVTIGHDVGFEVDKGSTAAYFAIFRDVFTHSSEDYGIALGRYGSGLLQNVLIYNGHFDRAKQAGLYAASVSGLIWYGGESLTCERAVVLAPGAGASVRACLFAGLFLDTANSEVVRLSVTCSDSRISTIGFDNVSMNGSKTGQGLLIAGLEADPSLIDKIRINTAEVTINRSHGIYMTHCTDISITAPNIISNGQDGAGSGIYVGAGTHRAKIMGGSSGSGSSFAPSQRYGVVIAAGAVNTLVTGADVLGNVTGPISDSGTDTIIRDCIGCKTFTKGVAVMDAGFSTKTVNHGLSFAPAVQDIQLTNLTNPALSGATMAWVSAVTATTFTITNATPLDMDHSWGWAAGVKDS